MFENQGVIHGRCECHDCTQARWKMSVGSIQGALAQGALTDSRKAFSLKPERALTEQYKQEAKSELFLLRQSLLKQEES